GGRSLALRLRSGGVPLCGATVQVRSGSFELAATSDDEGRVAFSGLAEGRFSARCEAPGHSRTYVEGVLANDLEREVDLAPYRTVVVNVRDPAGLPREGNLLVTAVGYVQLERGRTTLRLPSDRTLERRQFCNDPHRPPGRDD
ncbi:MAG: carboxypeptidase regulatory-like domain-containing protein, partial [Planctomycetes bacterium]|nr:carboxypeptidase regulatory-like domain-containing protein [Planctomycetota bacterium]